MFEKRNDPAGRRFGSARSPSGPPEAPARSRHDFLSTQSPATRFRPGRTPGRTLGRTPDRTLGRTWSRTLRLSVAAAMLAFPMLVVASAPAEARCGSGKRISHKAAECLSASWRNTPSWWPNTYSLKNQCSEFGDVVAKIDQKWAKDRTVRLYDGRRRTGTTGAIIKNVYCCTDSGDLCNRSDIVTDASCLARFNQKSPATNTCRNVTATAEITDESANCRISAECPRSVWLNPFVPTEIEVSWFDMDKVNNCDGTLIEGSCDGHSRPPGQGVSVRDAWALEGIHRTIRFLVFLDGPATGAVEVDYETADRTARAGSDYEATRGTLTFPPGEILKTIYVQVLDDSVDERDETFLVRLTNARGASIDDGVAVGTISNSDPVQRMWLSRFGRSVADHVVDAVSGRLLSGLPAGTRRLTPGSRTFDRSAADAGNGIFGPPNKFGGFSPELPPGSFGRDAWMSAKAMDRNLPPGSSFDLSGDVGGPGWAAWGRLTAGGFDAGPANGQGNVGIDGRVTTGTAGFDGAWGRWTVGIALSVSEGTGSYGQPGVDRGRIESSVTGLYPYVGYDLNDRVRAWGLVGYGTGDMTISRSDGVAPAAGTDLDMRLFAGGVRGALLDAAATGGLDLALKADALLMQIDAAAAPDTAATRAEASRLRFLLEGARTFALPGSRFGAGGGADGRTLTPSLELGLRYDGGDGGTGIGVEAGGGLRFADPGSGLSVETRGRALLAHEASGLHEWNASLAFRLDPGREGRGLSLHLTPSVGTAPDGAARLWAMRDPGGLPQRAGGAGLQLQAGAGYGFRARAGRGLVTPYAGLSFAGSGRAWHTGVRWRLDTDAAMGIEGVRSEPSGGSAVHSLLLRAETRW